MAYLFHNTHQNNLLRTSGDSPSLAWLLFKIRLNLWQQVTGLSTKQLEGASTSCLLVQWSEKKVGGGDPAPKDLDGG